MHTYTQIHVYIISVTFMGKTVFKRPLSPTISFFPTLSELGVFCGESSCSRTRLAPGCLTYARSKRHHGYAFGEPTCTWFGGRYQRPRPPQLSSFVIALQSEVHNAVQCFCIGLQCVPNKRSKNGYDTFSSRLGSNFGDSRAVSNRYPRHGSTSQEFENRHAQFLKFCYSYRKKESIILHAGCYHAWIASYSLRI